MREHANDALVVLGATVLGVVGWLGNLFKNPEVVITVLNLVGWALRTAYNEFRLRRRDKALRERERALRLKEREEIRPASD